MDKSKGQLLMDFNDIKTLGDICILKRGRNIDKKHYKSAGTPYIVGASHIQNGIAASDVYVNPGDLKNITLATKGDIIVSCVGTLGKTGLLKCERAVLSGHVFALSPLYDIDVLYLVALITYALADCVPDSDTDKIGFNTKLDPEVLMRQKIHIPGEDDQKWVVLNLVRFAIMQVAVHIDHITPADINRACDVLRTLQNDAKKRLRGQSKKLDDLEKALGEAPALLEDESPDNPFRILLEERSRINKLLKIL